MALKPIVQQISKLIILQSPFRSHEQFLRRLTYKPFEHQIRAQQPNKPDDDINILLYRIDMKGCSAYSCAKRVPLIICI